MIKLEASQDKLRLVIPAKYYPPRYLYLDFPDQLQYYPLAHQIKRLMEIDIATDSFDRSLEKYKPQKSDTLLTIWEQYVLFKKRFLHPSSVKNLTTVTNHLYRIPPEILSNPPSLKLWLVNNLTPEQARRMLIQIKACAKWGVEMGFLSQNPFSYIKGLKRVRHRQIDPFSHHERDLILDGFNRSEYYDYYGNFVYFLFLTGCRPSEAVALRWLNVAEQFILFKEAVVDNKYKNCTKTNIDRRFPINSQLRELLERIEKKSERVFNAKRGGVINLNNFTRRAWQGVLAGIEIRYRPPYNCRHTFITEMLQANIDVSTVAGWVGNSPEIIYRHYAGINDIEVPRI